MSSGKRIELKGKTIHKLVNYFESPSSHLLDGFFKYDDLYDDAITPIASVLKDYMSDLTVRQYVYASTIAAEETIRNIVEGGSELNKAQASALIIKNIVDDLSGFPRSYEWRVEFPLFYRIPNCKLSVTEGMYFDFKTGQNPVLVMNVSGYCGSDFNQPTMVKILSMIKRFIFVLEWNKVVHHTYSYDDVEAIIIDKYLGLESRRLLKSDMSQLIAGSRLAISQVARKMSATNLDVASLITDPFIEAGKLLEILQLNENSSIATAIEWYMDSRLVENQTVALLEICIGLEAILGDETEIKDMTNRLCDRLGFLLGNSREQRRVLSEQYRKVLSLRGKLVHSKQARLDQDGSEILSLARGLLRDVIEHELSQLIK